VNLTGVFHTVRLAAARMKAKGGSIVGHGVDQLVGRRGHLDGLQRFQGGSAGHCSDGSE
jgi:hypothetical protein